MNFLSKRSLVLLIGLFLILLVGVLLTYYIFLSPTGLRAKQHADLRKVEEGDQVAYTDLDGTPRDLEDFHGKPLIVNVWASWTPFTKGDHQVLREIKNEYGEKITILALDRMETKETAEAYLNSIGKEEGLIYIIDTTDHFFRSLEGYAMPETIVFDVVGNEVFRKRGALNPEELESVLASLVK
jgi:thiol-disulfide isomerase/thioredoxin